MGYFSWMFANGHNKRNLCLGKPAFLCCPDGTILFEPAYEGYGFFGGKDVYELVADWNRPFLSKHPELLIPQHSSVFNQETGKFEKATPVRVDSFYWYPAYADLSKSMEEVEAAMRACRNDPAEVYRWIGIAIACYDDQNAALPFPIKVCSHGYDNNYFKLPPSKNDPNQGEPADEGK